MLRASDSVRHSFNFVFDQIRSFMAIAYGNAAQLTADPGILTPPSRVVKRGHFAAYLAAKVLFSRNELRNWLSTNGLLIPFTIQHNLAESLHGSLRVMRSQANNISSFDRNFSGIICCCSRLLTAVDRICRLI